MYYQDCGQIKECWPNGADQTLLANTTQVFFGVNDQQTAEYVSSRLGEQTIIINSGGTSHGTSHQNSGQGRSDSTSTNTSENWQQLGKLLKPEEVVALSPRTAITLTPGVAPIATRLVRYYEKSFRMPRQIGPIRAVFDTACLFVLMVMLAVLWTAAFFYER